MDITVFGSGYVGLVTGACFAAAGNRVLCVDVDEQKIETLKNGELPIYEPGLGAIMETAAKLGYIDFTTDMERAVHHAEVQFIAVGTPPDEDGSADLKYVLAVAKTIAKYMCDSKIVVDKSTVPVGTADRVRETMARTLAERGVEYPFDVVSNPEFLKEGAAIEDFMKPDRIVVGTESDHASEVMRELYAPFSRNHEKLILMDVRSAELTKYAANAMLATKISFMNEIANLAERVGADVENVRVGMGSDPRIGYHFIYPGCGYGGSCFPKDVKALERTARTIGYEARILRAVEEVNERQKGVLFDKINGHFSGQLAGRTVALWGLSFKPNTDDMREAPSRVLMEALWDAGATVRAYDPEACCEARRLYGDKEGLVLCESPEEALEQADGVAVLTEWKVFRSPDFNLMKRLLRERVIFDGRNIYEPDAVKAKGFAYYGIGRLPN